MFCTIKKHAKEQQVFNYTPEFDFYIASLILELLLSAFSGTHYSVVRQL